MLHVILTILAVIGIIILCILGLLILIVLLVLFWPVKYKINASYFEKKYIVSIKVYWLLGIICDRMKITNEGMENKLKVLGFALGEDAKPKKNKTKTQTKSSSKKKSVELKSSEPEVLKRIRAEKKSEKEITKKKLEKKTEKKTIFQKVKDFFTKLKEKVTPILDIIKDPNNKESFRFIKKQLFYLLKKIRPRKIKADIKFGLGDPALTGQALGGIAVLMGIAGRGFAIEPDFENKIIQGEIEIKGRVFIVTILLIALRIFRNKGLRKSYKKLKQLKV